MNLRRLLFTATSTVVFAGFASTAAAEIVHLTSGRTLSVKAHRIDGRVDRAHAARRRRSHLRPLADRADRGGRSALRRAGDGRAGGRAGPTGAGAGLTRTSSSRTPYGEVIAAVSEAHGVDPMLVRAVIEVESNYRARARSHRGAMGLMQLMPATAREYKVRNPYDPKSQHRRRGQAPQGPDRPVGRRAGAGRVQRGRGGGPQVQRDPAVPRNAQLRHQDPVARRHPLIAGPGCRRLERGPSPGGPFFCRPDRASGCLTSSGPSPDSCVRLIYNSRVLRL